MSKHKVIKYQDEAGEYRWRRVASNGEIVADSAEGYANSVDRDFMATEVNGDDVEYVIE